MDKIKNGGNQVCAESNNVSANGTGNKHFNLFNMEEECVKKEILKGLSSENETEVLSFVGLLLSEYSKVEKHSDFTYMVTCYKFADCVKKALTYLKISNKQFEEAEQHIDVIATTDNDNVFMVLTK